MTARTRTFPVAPKVEVTIRQAVNAALDANPEAGIAELVQTAGRALDKAGIRRPPPPQLLRLVQQVRDER